MYEVFFQSHAYTCMLRCFSRVLVFATYELQLARILCPWDSSGKNTRVGCHFILQGIFLIQDEIHIPYVSCIDRQVLYHKSHLGNPVKKNSQIKGPIAILLLLSQSCLTFCDPRYYSTQASPSFTISQSLLKLMPIQSMMPSNNLILCHCLLLLPSIFPSIRVFSNKLAIACLVCFSCVYLREGSGEIVEEEDRETESGRRKVLVAQRGKHMKEEVMTSS